MEEHRARSETDAVDIQTLVDSDSGEDRRRGVDVGPGRKKKCQMTSLSDIDCDMSQSLLEVLVVSDLELAPSWPRARWPFDRVALATTAVELLGWTYNI